VRLSGPSGAIAAAAAELGGEETPPHIWEDLRHRRLGPQTAPRLWRLSISRTAHLTDLPGDLVRDWAGAEIWLASDAPTDRIRRLAAEAGGHATLYRGARPGEEVFAPLPAPLLALHKRLKAGFDPAGVFNPGRMYEGL
jgi:glycolate oxidase FAD binding subunit